LSWVGSRRSGSTTATGAGFKAALTGSLTTCDCAGAAEQFAHWNKGFAQVLLGLTKRRADKLAIIW
jgi:GH24 family phage-related lysozyme (muramidase)